MGYFNIQAEGTIVAVYLKKSVYSFSIGSKNFAKGLGLFCASVFLLACTDQPSTNQETQSQANEVEVKQEKNPQAPQQTPLDLHHTQGEGKPVIYQVFTRLFGNTNTTNKPWGTIDENGVGKFADFNDAALQGIKELGTSYIWYTTHFF